MKKVPRLPKNILKYTTQMEPWRKILKNTQSILDV